MHAGEEVAVDDVVGGALDDAAFVVLGGVGLFAGDEGRADVGEVGTHGLGGQDGAAGGDGAGQGQGAIEPLAEFLDQRERALHPGMATGPGGDGDQAVGAFLDGLAGERVVDHVMQDHAAVGMGRRIDVLAGPQRGDDDRHLVLHAERHVVLQAVVALVHDLVDRERRRRLVGVGAVVGVEGLGDLGQPVLQQGGGPGVERRHGADDPGLALLDHQLGVADDEQRRADHREGQAIQRGGQS
ncbi:hypothetical protein FQZ97_506220 [compost metagenome]